MAMIESAFKSNAHSRARAHGFWQFIDGTASRYGLRTTRYVDERSDPEKSTRAAARYLRDLYEMFGDWYLAMAAYDAGEGKILKGLQRLGATDYWQLAPGAFFRRETQDYVPFVIAAALISRDPASYGFDVVPDPPLRFDVVRGSALRRPGPCRGGHRRAPCGDAAPQQRAEDSGSRRRASRLSAPRPRRERRPARRRVSPRSRRPPRPVNGGSSSEEGRVPWPGSPPAPA